MVVQHRDPYAHALELKRDHAVQQITDTHEDSTDENDALRDALFFKRSTPFCAASIRVVPKRETHRSARVFCEVFVQRQQEDALHGGKFVQREGVFKKALRA